MGDQLTGFHIVFEYIFPLDFDVYADNHWLIYSHSRSSALIIS